MRGADLRRHQADTARACKGLKDALAANALGEVQEVIHYALLRTAERQDAQGVALEEGLRLDRQAVSEAIEDLVTIRLALMLYSIGKGRMLGLFHLVRLLHLFAAP